MRVPKSKEPAYMLIFLPCCPNLSNKALYDIGSAFQVHLELDGIIFVNVLYYGIVIANLGAATEPRAL